MIIQSTLSYPDSQDTGTSLKPAAIFCAGIAEIVGGTEGLSVGNPYPDKRSFTGSFCQITANLDILKAQIRVALEL